jgi:P27 family predicted phage terminase small subunit
MGRRGPAPEPVGLKILKGIGGGRDQAGAPIPVPPAFDRGAPEPPAWLEAEALKVWTRVAPSLDRLDLLKDEDREAFAAYCTAWARFVDAVGTYQAEGLTIAMPPSGRVVAHPAVRVAESAGRDLLRFAQEFGLTPSAEINLAKPAKPVSSDDDKFGGTS